jgi:hypothetical protein
MSDGAEPIVRQAVEAFMAATSASRDPRRRRRRRDRAGRDRHRTGSGAPVDQTYWLGARVRAAKIVFLGFFRTEDDALEVVT